MEVISLELLASAVAACEFSGDQRRATFAAFAADHRDADKAESARVAADWVIQCLDAQWSGAERDFAESRAARALWVRAYNVADACAFAFGGGC